MGAREGGRVGGPRRGTRPRGQRVMFEIRSAIGFDVRTPEQKAEDERQKEAYRLWTLRSLASRYNREKIYEEIWSEPIQHVAKRYNISDVGLAKVCRKLNIPRPGRGYWAMKAAGKPVPRRPPLSKLPV